MTISRSRELREAQLQFASSSHTYLFAEIDRAFGHPCTSTRLLLNVGNLRKRRLLCSRNFENSVHVRSFRIPLLCFFFIYCFFRGVVEAPRVLGVVSSVLFCFSSCSRKSQVQITPNFFSRLLRDCPSSSFFLYFCYRIHATAA